MFRIGIVGGMGPLAGIHLQKLIVDATPATRDQDHVEVLCFTNPHIPDRTTSLATDHGDTFVRAIIESLQVLHRGGASHAVLACNTSHACIDRIQSESPLPVINLIETGLQSILKLIGPHKTLGLLATQGTIRAGVYSESRLGKSFTWALPTMDEEAELMDIIYGIKAGRPQAVVQRMITVADQLKRRGADAILLACTELSIYFEDCEAATNMMMFDPLRILATHLVGLSSAPRES